MKNSIGKLVLFLIAMIGYLTADASELLRVEPPFWWSGMHNENLQLLIYGKDIGDMDVKLRYNGVKIMKVHRPENKNYLFVDLEIKSKAKAGLFNLQLSKGEEKLSYDYELKARRPGSAERAAFTSKDVLYLVTPDRFANGDTSNDEVDGMEEGYDRVKPYGRHGGDIQGLMDNLDYMKDMGFSALWLNPVLENDQPGWSYHGYATTDYYKVDSRFGTNEQYVELSRKAKDMGIGMIMDIIVNHCGHYHWWMKDPPFNNWINFQKEGYKNTNHRKTTLVDPYVAQSERDMMTKGWFVEQMPDLNQRNPFMSTYLIQNTIWWIEYADLYGIRQDTYSYPFREFMTAWTCAIKYEYPNMNIVGEEWIEEPAVIAYWQEGKINKDGYTSCLPSLMDFPLCFTIHKSMNEEEAWGTGLVRLYELLGMDFLYADASNLVIFPDNHDMSRIYTQVDHKLDRLKMAISIIMTTRGIPQLYYGTEILMSNPDTDSHGIIRSDFPGGWADDKVNAFSGEGLDKDAKETQAWMKKLINWRNGESAIHSGKMMHYEPRSGVYVYFRYDSASTVMIVVNKNEEATSIDPGRFKERMTDFISGFDVVTGQKFDMTASFTVPARMVSIIKLAK
ncbi:MAG: glycoside hydrolase family 13 protein [Saprospiraceae bacterium]|nr:glycoside hydrolase family 13 protein [Saprospiraceae bacterium]